MTTVWSDAPLPEGVQNVEHHDTDSGTASLGIRRVRTGELVDAYPAGTHDLQLFVQRRPAPDILADYADRILTAHPRCRRIVFAAATGDLDTISWAEEAGFRFVVDVQTRAGEYALLVIEPEWVSSQPQVLEDIPLEE